MSMKSVRKVVVESVKLAQAGDRDRAVTVLEEGISHFRTNGDLAAVGRLARHAGVLCDKRWPDRARANYELALLHFKDDSGLHLVAGLACLDAGDSDAAARHFQECYEVAKRVPDGSATIRFLIERGYIADR
jgi:hypothetical protein